MGKSTMLEIRLFGSPQILLGGESVEGIRRKNRALVFYLAAHDDPILRDQILTLFWPDHERSASQPILRTMIHDLRKELAENFQADDRSLSIAPSALIDAHSFSTTLASSGLDAEQLTRALAFYKGDFLEGFSLADSPQLDDWAASERDRYRLMASRGFAELSRAREARRDYAAALESMRRALAFNEFQEELQRDVMRLLYLNGDRAGMIRQYEALRKLLDEELGVPPMPETRELYDALISDSYAAPVPVSSVPTTQPAPRASEAALPFIGREAEIEALKSQFGPGRLLLVEGEPGIGKTRLVSELIAAQLRTERSMLILQGAAYELEQGLPYQPITDALRGYLSRSDNAAWLPSSLAPIWLTELARLLPELLTQYPQIAPPAQPADEARLWEALLRFLQSLAERQRVWLFLDDLHWADASTIAWLGYAVRHATSPSLIFVSTTRPMDGASSLAKLRLALRREGRLAHVELSTLDHAAMGKMAAALSPGQREQLSGWLIENAEGNPFFLTELVRYARGIGLLSSDGQLDAELFSSQPVIPATIQNLIASRLLRLSEAARDVIHLAAVVGREFQFELLEQAASLPEAEALDAIEELQAAHLIRSIKNDSFVFDHSLTMQVALQDISSARQRSLHRRVAETLESLHHADLDAVAGLVARHYAEANLAERAAEYSFRAGQAAASLAAWVEALAFYEQALAHERDSARQAAIFIAIGTARFHTGEFLRATEDYRTAVRLAGQCKDWRQLETAHLTLNQPLLPQARFEEAIALAKELRESGPPELAICAEVAWSAALSVQSSHPTEAERHLREAERLLQEQPDYTGTISAAQIAYQLAAVIGQQGRSREAVALYQKAAGMVERGESRLDLLRNIMVYNNMAYHMNLIGDPAAENTVRKAVQMAQDRGSTSHLPYLYSTSGEIALTKGDVDAAEKFFRDGLELAKQIPVPERVAGMTANLGLAARQRGETGKARELLTEALGLAQQLGSHHLEVRIRIWLAPLLPPDEARGCLAPAHLVADKEGLQGLLDEIVGLEKGLQQAP